MMAFLRTIEINFLRKNWMKNVKSCSISSPFHSFTSAVPTLYKMDASPPARSARMMVDLLGLEAKYVEVNILAKEHMKKEYRKMNPIHTVPTLDDNGFIIFESNAIAAYLVDKYAKDDSLYPKDLQKRAIVNQRLLFNSAILFPAFRMTTADVLFRGVGKVTDKRRDEILNTYKLLEALLASTNGSWFTGDQLTIADICTMSTVSTLDFIIAIDASKYPKVDAWLKKCSELPTFQKINVPGIEFYKKIYNGKLH